MGSFENDQVLVRTDEGRVSIFVQQTDHEDLSPEEAKQILDDLLDQVQRAQEFIIALQEATA